MNGSQSLNEKRAREDLAAVYRLLHHYEMTDMHYTHTSLRIQTDPPVFLINPYNYFFEEICASNLVPIDIDGNKLNPDDHEINPAAFTIHSAIHAARPDAHAVMHTHTLSGMAVAALEEGLLPLNQISMGFYNHIAYHDYEGISFDLGERERIVASLGQKNCLIMRNHGLITVGKSVGEAFYFMYYLTKACDIQVAALSMGRKVTIPSPEICEHAYQQYLDPEYHESETIRFWEAQIRRLNRIDPSYRN